MINSVTSNSQLAQTYSLHHQPNTHVQKNSQNEQQPTDTVVLSKQATGTADVDHDGDNH